MDGTSATSSCVDKELQPEPVMYTSAPPVGNGPDKARGLCFYVQRHADPVAGKGILLLETFTNVTNGVRLRRAYTAVPTVLLLAGMRHIPNLT